MHSNIMLLAVQERRVNVIQSDMQNKLCVKDETLKQLKAIVMESKTFGHRDPPPCQTQPPQLSGEESPLEKSSGSPSPLSVRCVDDAHVEYLPPH